MENPMGIIQISIIYILLLFKEIFAEYSKLLFQVHN